MRFLVLLWVIAITASGARASEVPASLQAGRVIGLNIYGLAYDFEGNPLMVDGDPLIYSAPARNVKMEYGQQRFIASLFHGPLSALYLTRLGKDGSPVNTAAVDASSVQGLANVSFAVKSVWGSLLLPESGQVDARDSADFAKGFSGFYAGKSAQVNPYDYGWLSELVLLDEKGANKVVKHYAVGRIGASDVVVLPDQRTIYLYDGLHSGNLYLFVADEPASLAKGKLFGVSVRDGKARLIALGAASGIQVRLRLKRATFSDIYEYSDAVDGQCAAGFSLVDSYFGVECLRANARLQSVAGLLEPAREFARNGGVGPGIGFERLRVDDGGTGLELQSATGKRKWKFGRDDSLDTDYALEERP